MEGNRKLNLYCIGEGSPTVVFEAGQGRTLASWGYVQPLVAKKMRACSYDRAGLGFSDGNTRPSTSANIVDDLHHLLISANIKPPYVLVGHSLGGMTVRLFADKYPAEVVGMVLVDPEVENQTETFRKIDLQHRTVEQWRIQVTEPSIQEARNCVDAAKAGLVPGTDRYKQCVEDPLPQMSDAVNKVLQGDQATLKFQLANLSETENQFFASADQVRASRHSYGDLPLIVLTRGSWGAPEADATPEDLAHHEAIVQAWSRAHDDVAKMSMRGVNEVVPGARHFIQFDKPQVVIDAIDRVVAQAAKLEEKAEK